MSLERPKTMGEVMAHIYQEARRQGADPTTAAAIATGRKKITMSGITNASGFGLISQETLNPAQKIEMENLFDYELHQRKKDPDRGPTLKPKEI